MSGKVQPKKIRKKPAPMNKPAMMDWALRLLRLLNERKVLNSRIVAKEFDVNIRTAQRYLLYLSDLPCVVVDEEVAHFFERKSIFPRQEIVRKEKDGKIVVSFDVHNDMDFREHIARWMPFFQVLEPARYREIIRGIASQVATRNEGLTV